MLDSSAPTRCRRGRWSGWVRGQLEDTRSRLSPAGRGGVGAAGAEVHGDGGDGDGEGLPSRRRRKLEPELASAPDRGLDAQPVPAPDRGLDELATRLECGLGDAGVTRP